MYKQDMDSFVFVFYIIVWCSKIVSLIRTKFGLLKNLELMVNDNSIEFLYEHQPPEPDAVKDTAPPIQTKTDLRKHQARHYLMVHELYRASPTH